MNPNTESAPTNPNPNSSNLNDWFEQVNVPSSPEPKRSKKLLLIIVLILLAALIGLAIATALLNRSSPDVSVSCFKAGDYSELLTVLNASGDGEEITIADVKPQQLLYTHSVYFTPTKLTLDIDESATTTAFVATLGSYSKASQASAPIVVHVGANYSSSGSPVIAQQRINKVKEMLVAAGFDASYIVTIKPELIIQTGDIVFDEDDVVTIELAPSVSCEE